MVSPHDAWLAAADDLGIPVQAPFSLSDAATGDSITFVAKVEGFGSVHGTAVIDRGPGDAAAALRASDAGMFASIVGPEAYVRLFVGLATALLATTLWHLRRHRAA